MARKKRITRDTELSTRADIREDLLDIIAGVEKGFADQRPRSDDNLDYWDAYNCILSDRQYYNGNSKIYVPIIRTAIKARRTRFLNQIFPKSGRNIEVVTSEQDPPHHLVALLESYIDRCRLRTEVMPALLTNGDVEGQYTIYLDWDRSKRHTTRLEKKPVEVSGTEIEELGEVEVMTNEVIDEAKPTVDVIADNDFLVLPATVDSLEEALERGGSVSIIRRWSKRQIEAMVKRGDFTREGGDAAKEALTKKDESSLRDIAKDLAKAIGIKAGDGGRYCQGVEVWTKMEVNGEQRLCRAYFATDQIILGCKLNPNWNDRLPIVSAPVEKVPGVFKGMSLIGPGVLDMQVAANDAVNEGMDSAAYALMPIIMTDPKSNPKVGSMILDLAAVWEVDPATTKFAQFPELWKSAFEIVGAAKNEIFQALSVNPAMIPQQTGGKSKRNQAEIANEQQVDILTTADAVTLLEGSLLSPLVQRFAEMDHQYREDDELVRSYGEMGLQAILESIPPIQMNRRIQLRWFGVEAARNAAAVQQKIAGMNVLRGIPPQTYPGYKLNLAPLIVNLVEDVFGPRLGPLVFQSMKDQLSVSPEIENDLLDQGMEVLVHAMDEDAQHIQAHSQAQPGPQRDSHIKLHQLSMQMKQAAQQQGGGEPGVPGGAGRGVAGTPRPGGQPANPRQNKGPPGMIPQDQMGRAGAAVAPRRA